MSFKEYILEKRFSLADFAMIVLITGIVGIVTTVATTLLELVIH